MGLRLLTTALHVQADVVAARQRARQLSELLGFDPRDQTRIATSVSEIARNAFRYAGGGKVEFEVEGEAVPQLLVIRVVDHGPGIERLDEVLDGTYRSSTGMGIGLIGSRRLMDRCDIHSERGKGTTVTLGKLLPAAAGLVTPATAGRLMSRLAALPQPTSLSELQSQNVELLEALAELQEKQDKLVEMARELEDTNRGVVALYAELDENAAHLRQADQMKSRFLSNMSHEFRTPLNSVRALCTLLLSKMDGPLTGEQETQVRFIHKAAEDLGELVNDLLDLAKIEAGKVEVRPIEFHVDELFSALRGMLRPLLVTDSVELTFDAAQEMAPLFSDESKVSQILRNFISNALKFTERGSVRVEARGEGDDVVFAVHDTGIGIAPEDREMIFEEFTQVPNALQRKVKGTGLGLPLCRKLAALLGGRVWVESEPGRGSSFYCRIPAHFQVPDATREQAERSTAHAPEGAWVLLVEDDAATRLLHEKFLKGSGFDVIAVATLAEARERFAGRRPAAIVLDMGLPGEEERTWRWLAELKADADAPPVIVASASGEERKALSLGADAYLAKPVTRDGLRAALARLAHADERGSVALIIDDDAAARYVIRRSVRAPLRFEEAMDGESGLEAASRLGPRVIFLDLGMPGMPGDEVLERLAADPGTRGIPVIVVTSHELDAALRARLEAHASAILAKRDLSVETMTAALESVGSLVP